MKLSRYISGGTLLTVEILFLALPALQPHLWILFLTCSVLTVLVLLFPLSCTPLQYAPVIMYGYVKRKISKPVLQAALVPQNSGVTDAVLFNGVHYFFAVEITPKHDAVCDRELADTIKKLLHQKNSVHFTHVTLQTIHPYRGCIPTYNVFFYVNLTSNTDFLHLRSTTPLSTVMRNASQQAANQLADVNWHTRLLTTGDVGKLAAWFIPKTEKTTYVSTETLTWSLYTSTTATVSSIMEKLAHPVVVAQEFHYHHNQVVSRVFAAAAGEIGSVAAKTKLTEGTLYRVRFQQYPILTWFIPTPKPLPVRGAVIIQ